MANLRRGSDCSDYSSAQQAAKRNAIKKAHFKMQMFKTENRNVGVSFVFVWCNIYVQVNDEQKLRSGDSYPTKTNVVCNSGPHSRLNVVV